MTDLRDEQQQAGDGMRDEGSDPTPLTPPSLALRALRALNAGGPSAAGAPPAEPETTLPAEHPPAAEPGTTPLVDAPPALSVEPHVGSVQAPRRYGVVIAAVVLVGAAVFCALSALSWTRAKDDTTVAHAAVRDAVLRGARIDIETVNTSDYRDPAHVLDTWTAVSTGDLAAQYKTNRTDAINVLTQAKVVTKATVVDAAVTTIDYARSTATVIASVDVVRTPTKGPAARTRNRFQATLVRSGSSWLLSGLKIVSVQLS